MEGFSRVARREEVAPGEMKLVKVGDEQIVLANLGGRIVAFSNTCPHAGCDLVYGVLGGEELECDCHGSLFNVSSGAVLQGPALEPLTLYAVRLEGNDLLVGPR